MQAVNNKPQDVDVPSYSNTMYNLKKYKISIERYRCKIL